MEQLRKFQNLPRAKKILFRESPENRAFHLHCTLLGGGHELLAPGTDYRLDGRKRGERYFCNLQYCLAGQGALRVESPHGALYRIQAGDLFFAEVPGSHCYYLPPEAREAWEFVYLTLTGSETRRIVGKIVELNRGPVLSMTHEHELYVILQALLREGTGDMLFYSAHVYHLLLGILAQQVQVLRQEEWDKLPPKVRRMKEYLQTHFAEDGLATRDIAQQVGLSETYAMDLFKRHTGQTLHQYLEQLRLTQAQNLLRYSMRSVNEVARLSGFRGSNYFIRVFRKHFGVSPGKSRELA